VWCVCRQGQLQAGAALGQICGHTTRGRTHSWDHGILKGAAPAASMQAPVGGRGSLLEYTLTPTFIFSTASTRPSRQSISPSSSSSLAPRGTAATAALKCCVQGCVLPSLKCHACFRATHNNPQQCVLNLNLNEALN
jgi:hypothetical protein